LSPNIFKLYINDLDWNCCPVQLGTITLNCLMYAGDLILLSEDPRELQHCLDKLQSYCLTWGLDVNVNKMKTLIFNNTCRLISTPFYFNNSPISNARNYTYLGVTFNI
jgi:hypothetical protein